MPTKAEYLLQLSHYLGCLATGLEAYDSIEEDHAWIAEGKPHPAKTKKGGKFAIRNMRQIGDTLFTAKEIVEKLPPTPPIIDVREVLHLTWETMGQIDIPAEINLENGYERGAIAQVKEAIFKAWESCGGTLAKLAAKLAVAAELENAGQIPNDAKLMQRRPSPPVTMALFARALGMSVRKVKPFLESRGLQMDGDNRQSWTIDYNKTEPAYIDRIEAEIKKDMQSRAN